MPATDRIVPLLRFLGAAIAGCAAVLTPCVIAKLYTGRGGDTPVRSAFIEQPLLALLGLIGLTIGCFLLFRARVAYDARDWLNPRWVLKNRSREIALLMIVTLVCLGLLEFASRYLYAVQRGFPITYSLEELVYPPLFEQFQNYSDEGVHVLLIGGSVLYFAGLEGRIESAFDPPARVHNLAQTAHSSLDARTKLEWALERGYRFDYVIFYEGINDVRANNVPPDRFDIDYNHYFFYRRVNTVFNGRKPWLRTLLHSSLFYRAYELTSDLAATRMFGRGLVHLAFPREDWLRFGGDVRSAESFHNNLSRIANACEQYGAKLIVPRYAYDPRLDQLARGELDWTDDQANRYTEQWGLAENVRKGIQAHNRVIEEMSGRFHLVDTSPIERPENFVDPCHLTPDANQQFIDILIGALRNATVPDP